MYLAAIADSQPPQSAPLSQVLMLALLVSLALSDLVTPKLFSLVKSTLHRSISLGMSESRSTRPT